MKIGLMGAHGVGKTSLGSILAYIIKTKMLNGSDVRVDNVAEVARTLARRREIALNEQTTIKDQQRIVQVQIDEEIVSCYHSDISITDRTVLDNGAYLVYRFDGHDIDFPEYPAARKLLYTIGEAWMRTYDHLFMVPITAPPQPDQFRSIDPVFQQGIEETIYRLLKEWNVPYETIPIVRGAGLESMTFEYEQELAQYFAKKIDLSEFKKKAEQEEVYLSS